MVFEYSHPPSAIRNRQEHRRVVATVHIVSVSTDAERVRIMAEWLSGIDHTDNNEGGRKLLAKHHTPLH
ncbi:MAG TPA: hypothetical protein VFZ22_06765 [Pyrinomonadaceae bacterium]|nr:hypothetical protein [Pyrinomonadaceae bacterium]